MDYVAVVRALRAKTVANGCTPGEADSAREKAEELMRTHGLTEEAVRPEPRRSFFRDRSSPFTSTDMAKAFTDLMREWERQAYRAREEAPRMDPKEVWWARVRMACSNVADRGGPSFGTIGNLCWALLMLRSSKTGRGMPYERILAHVAERFRHSRTTVNSLRYYETQMRKRGWQLPESRG